MVTVPTTSKHADINVEEILKEHEKGISEKYCQLCVILSSADSLQENQLLSILLQLRECVGLLTQGTKSLIFKILNIDWADINDKILNEHSQFLVSLAVGQVCYLEHVLRCVVKKFVPNLPPDAESSTEALENLDLRFETSLSRNYGEAHSIIGHILRISPMCKDKLMEIVISCFPFMRRHAMQIRDYVRNILCLAGYVNAISIDVLRVIVEELLRIDTVCSKEIANLLENHDEASSSNEIFAMDCEDEETKKNFAKLCELKFKLDIEMVDMFDYITNRCQDSSDIIDLFREFLSLFERIVMPVFSCSYVQYIWFYLCSLNSECCGLFLTFLWHKIQDPNLAPMLRQSASCYLSSFLARAVFVNPRQCKIYLDLCVSWLHQYLNNEDSVKRGDAALHGTFYAVFQAVIYVISFRHQELLEMKKGHDYLKSLNLDRLITSNLNPLKFCLESVVTNFASISRNYQFAFCYTIIERNRRTAKYDEFRLSFNKSSTLQRLDCFFPFDPYTLSKSLNFISPIYRQYVESTDYEPVAIAQKKRKSKSKEIVDEEDDFLMDDLLTSEVNAVGSYKTQSSFLSYGVSPGFKSG